jgi:hypothetical protein
MKHSSFVIRYLLLLPAGAIIIGFASLCLIRYDNPSISDIRRHGLGYNTITYHGFSRVNCDNDIVMVGDSTLLMGIIPNIIEKKLNATVISLGLYATSGLQSYTLMLDNYLRRNKKPKCIVFYFSASTPYYFNEHTYEKSYTLLKYGALTTFFQSKEVDFSDVVCAAWTIVTGISKNIFHITNSRIRFRHDISLMDTTKGYVRNAVPTPIDPDCKLNTSQKRDLELYFIDQLRKRYENMGIRVLYCISPMPESDSGSEFFKKNYTQVDNAIITLPNCFFTDSRHMTESGAVLNSKLFADYLQTKFRRNNLSR